MTWTILPADQFPRHRTAWDGLNASCGASQLLDSTFIEATLRHFSAGGEIIALHSNGEEVDCMGLLEPRSRFSWQTFQPANAPLGCWLAKPDTPLRERAHSLLYRLAGLPLVLGITQQDPAISLRPPLTADMGELDYIETPSLAVGGTFDEYWQSRSKNLRHNIQRQLNRLRRDGLSGRFEIIDARQQMAPCVADYAELETQGWKGREQTAVTAGDRQAAFYREILETFAAVGEASVWRYFLGDRLAASNLCIQRNGVLIILKTAYDESFKGFSPAQLMNYEALRAVFDSRQINRIEFYGPVKDWHTKLTGDTRMMYHLNFYRSAWVKRALARLGRHKSHGNGNTGSGLAVPGMGQSQ